MSAPVVPGWASKIPPKGKWKGSSGNAVGHYLEADGAPACSKVRLADGRPARAPFLAENVWTVLNRGHHLCAMCRRLHPNECMCGRCGIVPAPRREP